MSESDDVFTLQELQSILPFSRRSENSDILFTLVAYGEFYFQSLPITNQKLPIHLSQKSQDILMIFEFSSVLGMALIIIDFLHGIW